MRRKQQVLCRSAFVGMDRQGGACTSKASTAEGTEPAHAGRQLFMQCKQLLAAAEAKVGYDALNALLQPERRSAGPLERALRVQQRHQIERSSVQDLLLAQLMQQMAVQSQSLEQLQSTYVLQSQQLAAAKAEAQRLAVEVGQKRKRIKCLEWQGSCQEQSIQKLERQAQEYKRICSYVAMESQVLHL